MKRKHIIPLLKNLLSEFTDDNCFVLSAALSYYTAFSIAPILVMMIPIVSMFISPQEIQVQLTEVMGEASAEMIATIMKNASLGTNGGVVATIISVVMVFIGSTTVFSVLNNSLNQIWQVKADFDNDYVGFVWQRIKSFLMLFLCGLLLLLSVVANMVIHLLLVRFSEILNVSSAIFPFLNQIASLFISIILFTLVFKILSDAVIKWKYAFIGGICTAILFSVGKTLIGVYLANSNLGLVYGAAGSFAVLLTWLYYSSAILFLGAEIIKVYMVHRGDDIKASENAYRVDIVKQDEE